MEKITKHLRLVGREEISLGELIHREVRKTIELAVEEELEAVLGARPYERVEQRRGYRNGSRQRTLTGPTGPVNLTIPRATMNTTGGREEWRSTVVPRYQRRMREINEAVAGVYLSGSNTRRIKGALRPLLKEAPLSRSSVSRIVATFKGEMDAWRKQSLAELDVAYLYLDAIALRVRLGGRVTSVPVLAGVVVLSDGNKRLVSLEMCGSESHDAWKGFLDDLVGRKLKTPKLVIVDGGTGLRSAVDLCYAGVPLQRCAVHKLRNMQRKAPQHARDEIREDYHLIVYAASESEARTARDAFVRKWQKRCPGVVASLNEGGDEILTFFRFPREQWKSIRSTNVIERINEEFRRRVKTQGSFPTEDAGLVLLYALVASSQIKLRKLDGYEKIVDVISNPPRIAIAA
jgi:putative transposase